MVCLPDAGAAAVAEPPALVDPLVVFDFVGVAPPLEPDVDFVEAAPSAASVSTFLRSNDVIVLLTFLPFSSTSTCKKLLSALVTTPSSVSSLPLSV